MINIKVKIDDRRLKKLIIKNPNIVTEVLRKGAQIGKKNAQEGILHGRPEWQPLSESTVKIKGHEHILFETGVLVNTMVSGAQGRTASYGTNVEYAVIHELGLLEPKVPQRRFLMPTVEGHELSEMVDGMTNIARILYIRDSR